MLSLTITPKMRENIRKGLPAFKDGGVVNSQVNHNPTPAQIEAGNYKKQHVTFQGLNLTIENPRGSMRSGTDANGKKWSVKMPADYGYIKRTTGADGDHVDVYVGPSDDSPLVYIINQKDLSTGKFDEHKVMLGCWSRAEALKIYCAGFSDGKGKERAASFETLTIPEFKIWLRDGNTERKASSGAINKALQIATQFGPDAAQSAVKLASSK